MYTEVNVTILTRKHCAELYVKKAAAFPRSEPEPEALKVRGRLQVARQLHYSRPWNRQSRERDSQRRKFKCSDRVYWRGDDRARCLVGAKLTASQRAESSDSVRGLYCCRRAALAFLPQRALPPDDLVYVTLIHLTPAITHWMFLSRQVST